MEELGRKLVPYEVIYKCDECGDGEVDSLGKVHYGRMLHRCNKCGKEYWFFDKYPKVTYRYS